MLSLFCTTGRGFEGERKIKNTPTTKIRFTKEEMQQAENMGKYSTHLVIKEIQSKTMGYFLKAYQISKKYI